MVDQASRGARPVAARVVRREEFVLRVTGSLPSPVCDDTIVPSEFSVEVRRERHAAIVVPRGELDIASAPALQAQLECVWQSGAEQVIVDLREVEFMDSTGLAVIISAHRHAQEAGRAFGVVDGGEQVHKLLSLTGALATLNVATAPDKLLHRRSQA
jgi:anti-anti-sigma factor